MVCVGVLREKRHGKFDELSCRGDSRASAIFSVTASANSLNLEVRRAFQSRNSHYIAQEHASVLLQCAFLK